MPRTQYTNLKKAKVDFCRGKGWVGRFSDCKEEHEKKNHVFSEPINKQCHVPVRVDRSASSSCLLLMCHWHYLFLSSCGFSLGLQVRKGEPADSCCGILVRRQSWSKGRRSTVARALLLLGQLHPSPAWAAGSTQRRGLLLPITHSPPNCFTVQISLPQTWGGGFPESSTGPGERPTNSSWGSHWGKFLLWAWTAK